MLRVHRRVARGISLLVAGVFVALTLTGATASPAYAASIPGGEIPDDEKVANYIVTNSDDRTLNRWLDAANGFHSKYDGFVGTQLAEQVERNMQQGTQMSVGNFFYKVTSDFTQFAVTLDVIDSVGGAMDSVAKAILQALLGVTGSTGGAILFGVIFLIVLLLAVFRNFRRGMAAMARETAAVVVVAGLVLGIGMSALSHDGGRGDYNPAPATPGWVVKGVNDGITWLAAAPADVFTEQVDTPVWGPVLTGRSGRGLGCEDYLKEMDARFSASSEQVHGSRGKSMVSIAGVMDSLWESTGMTVWAKNQAGYENPFTGKVFCRILDFRAGTNPKQAANVTASGAEKTSYGSYANVRPAIVTDAEARAPFAPSTLENVTASLVAWAACTPTGFANGRFTWSWESGWEDYWGGIESPSTPRGQRMGSLDANTECQGWWDAKLIVGADGSIQQEQTIPAVFHVKGDNGWISDRASATDEVRDYLVTLTGMNPWGGRAGTLAYAVGGLMSMIAFGVIDIVVIVAKLFSVMFILALWFVLIGAMFRPAEMKDRLAKTFNKFLGTTVFASLTTIILTFVVIFTRALTRVAEGIWGAGAIGSMIFTGLAPLLALVLAHILFTKVFRLPSPVSIRGAQAWSKAGVSGAVGVGVGAGVGSFVGSRLGGMAKGAASKAGNAALSKISGGRLGRPLSASGTRSQMQPAGTNPNVSRDLAARADAGEQLTKAERKTLDQQLAANAQKDAVRNATIAREAAVDQRARDKVDLKTARAEHRDLTGAAAPGDFRGAAAVAGRRAAASAAGAVRSAGTRLSGVTGLTALRGELAGLKATRRAAVLARKSPDQDVERANTTATHAQNATASLAATHAVLGSTKAQRNRARWGAAPLAAGASVLTSAASVAAAGAAATTIAGAMQAAAPAIATGVAPAAGTAAAVGAAKLLTTEPASKRPAPLPGAPADRSMTPAGEPAATVPVEVDADAAQPEAAAVDAGEAKALHRPAALASVKGRVRDAAQLAERAGGADAAAQMTPEQWAEHTHRERLRDLGVSSERLDAMGGAKFSETLRSELEQMGVDGDHASTAMRVPPQPRAVAPARPAIPSASDTVDASRVTNGAGVVSVAVPAVASAPPATRAAAKAPVAAAAKHPPARAAAITPERAEGLQRDARTAIQRAAAVLDAPAATLHRGRTIAWRAQEATAARAHQIVDTRALRSARQDVKLLQAAAGQGMDSVRQSIVGRGATAAAERTAQTVKALGSRQRNNAQLLASYRARHTPPAEPQPSVSAAVPAPHVVDGAPQAIRKVTE